MGWFRRAERWQLWLMAIGQILPQVALASRVVMAKQGLVQVGCAWL